MPRARPQPARPRPARPARKAASAPTRVRKVAPLGVRVPERTVDVDGRTWTLRQEGSKQLGRGYGSVRVLSVSLVADGAGRARYLAAASLAEATEDQLAALVREATRGDGD